jgi:HPt (histidine-containing phosphotransfer) domain-containing protein
MQSTCHPPDPDPLLRSDEPRALIDSAHLAEQCGGDPALARDVLSLFVALAPALVERIASGDEGARDAAHQLKGAALALGAWPVADLAAEVEQGPVAQWGGLVPDLTVRAARTCDLAADWLARPEGPLAFAGPVA